MDTVSLSDLITEGYDIATSGDRLWPTYDGRLLNRQDYMTSSEANNCPRRIKFGKRGASKGFPNWGYAERGNVIEEWSVAMMRNSLPDNMKLLYAGSEQRSFYSGNQSGTPDGVIVLPDERLMVVEIKSIDPRTNYSKLPKEGHLDQVQQNMDMIERCLQTSVVYGQLLYIDASNFQRHKEFTVMPDVNRMNELFDKSAMIMKADKPEHLAATGLYTGECKLCDHTAVCSVALGQAKMDKEAHDTMERAGKNVFG